MTAQAVSKDGRRIRRMFAEISHRYDLLNHLLSLNVDRAWRRAAVRLLAPRPGERVLDLCTGTADLAIEIARGADSRVGERGGGPTPGLVAGCDFCPEMVLLGERKRRRLRDAGRAGAGRPGAEIRLLVADALRLPFAGESFDAAAVAFGVRNLEDLPAGLAEMLRILRPGGRAAILEFSTPSRAWFRALFGLYFHHLLPRLGRLVSRPAGAAGSAAYRYLPDSVDGFPDAGGLARAMEAAGFRAVRYARLTLGIACVHLGERPAAPAREGCAR